MRNAGRIDDDDSLLQDSLATPDRDTKTEILEQQKLRRKQEAKLNKLKEQEIAAKKAENMAKLQGTLKQQAMQMKVQV